MEKPIYTEHEIAEKVASLPKSVQDYIFSPEMEAALQHVGQKHQLHIDKLGLLETEVVDVMIGATEPENFVPYMVDTLEIDQQQANAIAQDVNTELFEKVRAYMRGDAVPPAQTQQAEPVRAYVPPPITNTTPSVAQRTNPAQPTPVYTPPTPVPYVQAVQPPSFAPSKPIIGFDKVSPTASVPVPATPPTATALPPIQQEPRLTGSPTPPSAPTSSATSAALQQTTITPAASMPPAQSNPSVGQTKQYSTDPYHEPLE